MVAKARPWKDDFNTTAMTNNDKFYIDVPEEAKVFASRRVMPLVASYGKHITTVPLISLAISCYLQAINDMLQLEQSEEPDYSI